MATSTGKKSKQSAARQWKRAKGEDITLPSGNVALVKRPGMEAFLAEGLLPDTLTPLINEAISNGSGIAPEKMKGLTHSPEQIAAMLQSMDRVCARVVIEPRVLWHCRVVTDANGDPVLDKGSREKTEIIPEHERDDDIIYTDDVDLEDKMFLFNYAVGGTRDLERFRQETESGLASLQDGEDVRGKAK